MDEPQSPFRPFDPEPFEDSAIPTDSEQGPEPRPNGALWMFYLFLRPKVFFRHFVIDAAPLLTALAAWMLGIASAIGEIDEDLMKSEFRSRPSGTGFVLENWQQYWLFCLAIRAFGGVLYYAIGGWWYRTRIRFCGNPNPDKGLANRVYLYASQVYAIPIVLYTLWETWRYATPASAYDGDDLGGVLLLLFMFWSIYASYRGVRTAFDLRRWAARMWFLILPACLYGVALAGLVVALIWHKGLLDTEPRLDQPAVIDRAGFTLRHPGNWEVNVSDEEYDPDHSFEIESSWFDASVSVRIHDEPIDPSDEAALTVELLEDAGYRLSTKQPVREWGRHQGSGFRFRMTGEDTDVQTLYFASTTDDAGFEIFEFCDPGACEEQEPGFAIIRESFELKPKAIEAQP